MAPDLQDFIRAFTPSSLERNFPFTGVTPSISQLSDNTDLLQNPIPEPIDLAAYSEDDHDWLVNVLDELIKFMHRDENWSVPELEEKDYHWAHALLIELVDAVGEADTHPLRSLMEFVCQLVVNYEDKYVSQLTELFPELIDEKTTDSPATRNSQPAVDTVELSEDKLAANVFFSIGCLLLAGERLEKALTAYDTAIFLKPNHAAAYNNRGNVRNILGQHEMAIADYSETIRLKPDYADAYSNRATAKIKLDQYESAIIDCDEAIRLNSENANAYNNRGTAKATLNQYNEAVVDFDKAIQLNSQEAVNYNNRGLAKYYLEEHEDAIADFKEAIRLNPDYTQAYCYRGVARSMLKQYEIAIDDYDEAIRINSDLAEAHARRGQAKVILDRIDEARSDFQTAFELATQQGNTDLKVFVEKQLQELNNSTPKTDET